MSQKEKSTAPQIIHTIPPSVDAKTWAEVQKRWAEIEEKKIDQTAKIIESLTKDFADRFERYYSGKISKFLWSSVGLIAAVIIASTVLAWIGRVGGETYAFLMGTVIGYLISILTKIAGGR